MNPGVECTFSIKGGKIFAVRLKSHPQAELLWRIDVSDAPSVDKLVGHWMEAYLAGQPTAVALPLDFSGVAPFTLQVLHKILAIPYGESLSYQEIARQLNNPLASRAVGQACGRNPLPLIIPCHRVLAKGRKLGGFSCGLGIKHFLLNQEKILFTGC